MCPTHAEAKARNINHARRNFDATKTKAVTEIDKGSEMPEVSFPWREINPEEIWQGALPQFGALGESCSLALAAWDDTCQEMCLLSQ
jgi:hypothetical protein